MKPNTVGGVEGDETQHRRWGEMKPNTVGGVEGNETQHQPPSADWCWVSGRDVPWNVST